MKNDIRSKLLYLSAAAFKAAKTKYKGGTFANASDSAFVRDLLAEVVTKREQKGGANERKNHERRSGKN